MSPALDSTSPLAWPAPMLLFSDESDSSCLARRLRELPRDEPRLSVLRLLLLLLRATFLFAGRRLLFFTTRRTTDFFGLRAIDGFTLRTFLADPRARGLAFSRWFDFTATAPLVAFFLASWFRLLAWFWFDWAAFTAMMQTIRKARNTYNLILIWLGVLLSARERRELDQSEAVGK